MIQRMEILQLPVMALQQRIEQEMNENPLLEVTEETETTEAEVGEELDEPETVNDQEEELVVEDNSDNAADFERLLELNREVPDHFDEPPRKSANQLDVEASRRHDAMANARERPTSLNDFLLSQLGELRIDETCFRMCMRIISALDADDGGRLNSSLEDLLPADASPEDLALAQRALEIVQSL
jgi:RNA polymerase sigma-54 factor